MSGEDKQNPGSSQTPSESRFCDQQTIGGKYRPLALIGKGGMGSVFRVQHIFLGTVFALKTLDRRTATETIMRRFQTEAKAASTLNHPNLVRVHDFGFLDDGRPYMVMDFVDGPTLAEYLREHGPMPVEVATKLFAQVCLGLSYAHEQGVVHRDIKPGNIIMVKNAVVGEEGSVKVVDFGIAKLTSTEDGEIQALTRTGEIFGSPLYMSPEQCTGGPIDHRCDVYSLGCVLYEALTGTPPLAGNDSLSTMLRHQSEEAAPLAEAAPDKTFSPKLQQLVATMLRKAPNQRYQNLGLVALDLSVLSGKNQDLAGAKLTRAQKKSTDDAKPALVGSGQLTALVLVTATLSAVAGGMCGYAFGDIQISDRNKQKSAELQLLENSQIKQPTAKQQDDLDENVEKQAYGDLRFKYVEKPLEHKFDLLFKKASGLITDPHHTTDDLHNAEKLLIECQENLKAEDASPDMSQKSEHTHARLGLVAINRGICAGFLDQIKRAETFQDQGAKVISESNQSDRIGLYDDLANLQTNIGTYYLTHGTTKADYKKAFDFYARAIKSYTLAYKRLDGVALCEYYTGQLELQKLHNAHLAVEYLEKAKLHCEGSTGKSTDVYVCDNLLLGQAYSQAGRMHDAERTYLILLPILKPLVESNKLPISLLVSCYEGLAFYTQKLGKIQEYRSYIMMAAKCRAEERK